VSVAAAQAEAFRREVRRDRIVWTVVEEGSFIAPHKPDGSRVMPFWSLRSRAQRVIENVAAYQGLGLRKFELSEFLDVWLPWLREEKILVGINWSGELAVGYDVRADVVAEWFPPEPAENPQS
jgi:uncharacterized protein DUF2750